MELVAFRQRVIDGGIRRRSGKGDALARRKATAIGKYRRRSGIWLAVDSPYTIHLSVCRDVTLYHSSQLEWRIVGRAARIARQIRIALIDRVSKLGCVPWRTIPRVHSC